MLHQNSITTCLLLLQQQKSLQNDINKYCELIFCLDPIIDALNLALDDEKEGNISLVTNLSYIIEPLMQAQLINRIIVKELQGYIDRTASKCFDESYKQF